MPGALQGITGYTKDWHARQACVCNPTMNLWDGCECSLYQTAWHLLNQSVPRDFGRNVAGMAIPPRSMLERLLINSALARDSLDLRALFQNRANENVRGRQLTYIGCLADLVFYRLILPSG